MSVSSVKQDLVRHTFLLLVASLTVSSSVVEHEFLVQNLVVNRLCKEQEIVAVNGQFPGPTIYAHEGDTVLVHVVNKSPYEITIHWHGVQMMFNCWADGANYVTQCPILPGDSFTYNFTITKQEGTLWWHAHSSWLRATVYGGLIIYPKDDRPCPFPKPFEEIPLLLGEWYEASPVWLESQFLTNNRTLGLPTAMTINGQPGDHFQCSSKDMYKLKVTFGKTYLLRIIHAGLNNELYFVIANHNVTVVAVDANYVVPYVTDVVFISPGQTIDVLLEANQSPASYYMTSYMVISRDTQYSQIQWIAKGTLIYDGATSPSSPILAQGPAFSDMSAAHTFSTSLKALTDGPYWVSVPQEIDEHMIITVGMGVVPWRGTVNSVCTEQCEWTAMSCMNNVSFELPTGISILESFYKKVEGVYTTDFPSEPPVKFDYTNLENKENEDFLWIGEVGTKVKQLKYNATVQIVFQNMVLYDSENHPIHFHGFNFHKLAEGPGNFDPIRDEKKFNLVDPPLLNTVSVPALGWVAIRFRANNPGVWFLHCHLEYHTTMGLGTAFLIENGPTESTSLPPPPFDFPKCNSKLKNTSDHRVVRQPVTKSSSDLNSLE